jgi:hypothetical protein
VGNNTRATIYFSPDIYKAVRMKAAATHRSISEIVNDAVRGTLAEDAVDLDAVHLLRDEPRPRAIGAASSGLSAV